MSTCRNHMLSCTVVYLKETFAKEELDFNSELSPLDSGSCRSLPRQCQILNKITHCPSLCLQCSFAHDRGFIGCAGGRIRVNTLIWGFTTLLGCQGDGRRRACVCRIHISPPSGPASPSSKYLLWWQYQQLRERYEFFEKLTCIQTHSFCK